MQILLFRWYLPRNEDAAFKKSESDFFSAIMERYKLHLSHFSEFSESKWLTTKDISNLYLRSIHTTISRYIIIKKGTDILNKHF